MAGRSRVPIPVGAVLIALGACSAVTWPDAYHAGFRIEQWPMPRPDGATKTLTCAVWYPTQAEEVRHVYNVRSTIGRVAVTGEADREDAPYPLVLYSHGYGGGGIAAAFFTEHLARNGFVVVAPDHSDADQVVRTAGPVTQPSLDYLRHVFRLAGSGLAFDHEAYRYRPLEARFALDMMLESAQRPDWPLAGLIDTERIGAVGHSFGSFTVLSISGLSPEYADSRIRAVLAFSGGVFMWRPEDWQRLRIPIMMMYGEKEAGQRARVGLPDVADNTRLGYQSCAPPKFLLVLRGGTHLTFCQDVIRYREPSQATGLPAEQVRAMNRRGLAFLQRYIMGDESREAELLREDPMWVEALQERQ